jgi:uncharacterized protein (UPF0276 family)
MPAPSTAESAPRALGAVVGIGWRRELAGDLLAAPETIGCAEVVAETCFTQRAARDEACAVAEMWPVVPHGVKLSLGSASGIDLDRARKLGALARELRAPAISEHVSLTSAGGRDIGHLTALPFTRAAVAVLAHNVARARRVLPDVPLLLENIAWTLRWPEDEMDEGTFHAEVAEATGCELLLDLGNLYANAQNAGIEPEALLRRYPLDRVGMVHIAGGAHDGGFYVDTHADAVPEPVFALLDQLLAITGPLPVILERDAGFPPFPALQGEIERARRSLQKAGAPSVRNRTTPTRVATTAPDLHLAQRQEALAVALTADAPVPVAGFDARQVARSRAILHHKRVDDALPLLRNTSAFGDAARSLAFRALAGVPRAADHAGLADARRIALAGCKDAALAEPARRDRLELRARFAGDGLPRLWPFVGSERLPGGRRLWAWKGMGRDARVRVL